jgi:hypothetical protein
VLLACAGLMIEFAWVLLWPIAASLGETREFTRSYIDNYPVVGQILDVTERLTGSHLALGAAPPANVVLVSLLVVFLLAIGGYLIAVMSLDRGVVDVRSATRLVLLFAALFQITLFLMPGLFTTDVFSYLLYARIAVVYGDNPYLHPADAYPDETFLSWINPVHQHAPNSYGPLWTDLSIGMEHLTQTLSPVDQVLVHKLLLNLLQVANLALLWWLLGRLGGSARVPRARLAAFTLFAWSPLVLFEVAGNAHNDGLTVTLLLLSLVPPGLQSLHADWLVPAMGAARSRRDSGAGRSPLAWGTAIVIVGLSALVKYTTAPVGALWLIVCVRQMPGWRARLLWAGAAGVGVLVTVFGLLLPSGEGLEVLRGVVSVGQRTTFLPGSRRGDLAVSVAGLLSVTGVDQNAAAQAVALGMSQLPRILFIVYFVWEMHRLWRTTGSDRHADTQAAISSAARVLLLLLLLTVTGQVTPWYFVVPLALASLLGPRHPMAQLIAGFALVCLSSYIAELMSTSWTRTASLSIYVLPLIVPLVTGVLGRRREGVGLIWAWRSTPARRG